MIKTYKFRLKPSTNQFEKLTKHFGHCRFIYNHIRHLAIDAYKDEKRFWNKNAAIKTIAHLKKTDYPWLKEANSQSLQQSIVDLDRAYKNFFTKHCGKKMHLRSSVVRKLKRGELKSSELSIEHFQGFPRPHRRKDKESFRIPQHVSVNQEHGIIFFPKFKEGIKYINHRAFEGVVKNATVTKTKSGKFYISLVVEIPVSPFRIPQTPTTQNSIGIDLGIKDFAILSDGRKISKPELSRFDKRIQKLNRKYARTQKGSKNREKVRLRLSKVYEKAQNIKDDFLHKASHEIISDPNIEYVFLENLNIKGMVKNHKLAKKIQDASWYKFKTFLRYKAEWCDKHVFDIGRFEPTSKMCSGCGYKNDQLTLKDRQWRCPDCGTLHDRDINAAVNIRNIGISTAGTAGFQACGESVSLVITKALFCETGSPDFKAQRA